MRNVTISRALRGVFLGLLALGACTGPEPKSDEPVPDVGETVELGEVKEAPVDLADADEVIVIERAREQPAPATESGPSTGGGGEGGGGGASGPRPAKPASPSAALEPVIQDAKVAEWELDDGPADSLDGISDRRLAESLGRGGGRAKGKLRRARKVAFSRSLPGGGGQLELPVGLQAKDKAGESLGLFPLRRTEVDAEASGWLATTHLRQTFENRFDQVVEAVYVFPLPTTAAVNDFVMEIQGRRIVGVVRPRDEAARIYAQARARGQTASLMSQERPNVFTQSVANIEPGGTVDVSITYFHELAYDEGAYEYVFPMVVGPRYMPGSPQQGPGEASDAGAIVGGGGTAVDTDQVPDASRISPPVLPEGMRSGRDVAVKVAVDAGVEIRRIECPTHDVQIEKDGPEKAFVALLPGDAIPNKDFILRWHVQSADLEPGFVAHRTEEHGGFFSAFLVPQLDPGDNEVTPREVTFVIDSSGSMNGVPINTCKRLVTKALKQMRPYDRFNIIRFAGSSGSLAETPIDVTPENVEKGLAYLQNLKGSGGTEMLAGVRHWINQPRDPRYLRVVVFLTDGFVGNEEGIHATIRDEGQDARWFAFGIGSSVNRFLVEGIADHGNGAVEVVYPREPQSAEEAADRLFRRFDSPMLVDVTVDANGLPLADVYPKRMPDLFSGEPIKVTGRFTGPATGEILFRGRIGDREVAIPVAVDLPAVEEKNVALASVWARTRIKDLSQQMAGTQDGARAEYEKQIEGLALEFRLVSSQTSFVAVDESRIVGDGNPVRILQPVELPEDVSYETAVGPVPGSMGLRVSAWGVTFVETADGTLAVALVDEGGAAAQAGLRPGAIVTSVGGHVVRSAGHLEALFQQAAAGPLDVAYRQGEEEPATASLVRP
jgi:Ca-activated chloride channel family protein